MCLFSTYFHKLSNGFHWECVRRCKKMQVNPERLHEYSYDAELIAQVFERNAEQGNTKLKRIWREKSKILSKVLAFWDVITILFESTFVTFVSAQKIWSYQLQFKCMRKFHFHGNWMKHFRNQLKPLFIVFQPFFRLS